jgi:hypothetical protein
MLPLCCFFVASSLAVMGSSGNRAATKQQRVAALLPVRNPSNEVPEVLRLGLEWDNFRISTRLLFSNPRISITPLVAIKKNPCIEALPFGHGKISEKAYWIYSLAAKIAASG